VLLRCGLPQCRVTGAIRRVEPMALVICGGEVRNSTFERLMHAVRQAGCTAPLYVVGETPPDTEAIRSLGTGAVEATRQLKAYALKRSELRPRTTGRRAYATG
jgi:hypothetical protein